MKRTKRRIINKEQQLKQHDEVHTATKRKEIYDRKKQKVYNDSIIQIIIFYSQADKTMTNQKK